jgi:hypothetical protein
MKHEKIGLSVAFLLLGLGGLHAQKNTNATGGDASGSGGTVAYSVGQVVYTTIIDASGSVSHGVQHAYEIFSLGKKEQEMNISLSVFPNPTTDNLTLKISDYNNQNLKYQLFDMNGKVLNNGEVSSSQTQINTTSLPSSTYFINVVNQENKQVQSFKIIKN